MKMNHVIAINHTTGETLEGNRLDVAAVIQRDWDYSNIIEIREPKYNLVDTCNDDEIHTSQIKLDEAQGWLIDFWANDDDTSEEQFNAIEAAIKDCTSAGQLNEYLAGIGYALDEIEGEN